MRKYQWLFIIILISCAVLFSSCDRTQDVLDSVISDPKPPETETQPPPTTPPMEPDMVGDVKDPDTEPDVVQPPVEVEPEVTEPTPPDMITETPPEPTDPTDIPGETIDIEDAMSTIGLRKIYWIPSSRSLIMRGNPDGSGIETIVKGHGIHGTQGPYSSGTTNLVVDSEGSKIYWNSNDSPGGLWRANLDGANIERLVTTRVRNFTLDLENGKIYWIAQVDRETLDTDHLFHRSNLDGSGVEKFKTSAVQALLGNLQSITFDSMDRKIYAHNYRDTKMFVIKADDLDIKFGDLEFEFLITNASGGFTLDIEDRKIYFIGSGSAYRVNLDGTNREELLSVRRHIVATFDFNTRKIYWGALDEKILWQANLDGSNPEGLFAVAGNNISHIAVEVGPIN